jgi:hypothetical protein
MPQDIRDRRYDLQVNLRLQFINLSHPVPTAFGGGLRTYSVPRIPHPCGLDCQLHQSTIVHTVLGGRLKEIVISGIVQLVYFQHEASRP